MTEKTTIYQNASIHYRIAGEGKTVVLVHGFAEDGDIWRSQWEFLAQQFRVIIPDLPGTGRSELIPNAGIETYAEIVKQIVDVELEQQGQSEAETINPVSEPSLKQAFVTLIGHSMGGYVALAFAEKYPQYLDGLALVHSSAFADDDEKKQTRQKAIQFIRTNGAQAFLRTSIPGLFTKGFAEQFPAKVDELLEKGKNFSADALVQYYEAMIARPDRTAVLHNLPKPILFIIGEHDTAIPLQTSLKQCYLPSQSHVHLLEQSAHMGMLEEEAKTNDILAKFLTGLSG